MIVLGKWYLHEKIQSVLLMIDHSVIMMIKKQHIQFIIILNAMEEANEQYQDEVKD